VEELIQVLVTPSAGKRLIAKALLKHSTVQGALKNGTLVIIAGTTNGYVAQEILQECGYKEFSRGRFFRGITLPPNQPTTSEGRLKDETPFLRDVVISKGEWLQGKTIQEVADSLREGDVIIKGANALDLEHKQAAVLIGHSKAGTAAIAIQAVAGRRVKLILAVGLEKRVSGNLTAIAEKLNSPGATGYRLLPLPGQVFTELDAINYLTGATAGPFAAGGVCGAEGSCWLEITGTREQEDAAQRIIASVANEPPFKIE
jgi:hypothetical protein